MYMNIDTVKKKRTN